MLPRLPWPLVHVREAYGRKLVELGRRFPDLWVLDADLSTSTKTAFFGREFPERFVNVGLQEQTMVNLAAGLALQGLRVVVSSFSVFLALRPLEMVRQSIAYPRLNVKIVATHGGVSVGPDGASHQVIEDVGIMTSIPNMEVYVPCDAPEVEAVVEHLVAEREGPAYVRLSRERIPVVHDEVDFRPGRGEVLRDGSDVAIISNGFMTPLALLAAERLSRMGIDAAVVNMTSVKPLDGDLVEKMARETGFIVTAEEHNIYNGLGSRVAELLAERYPTPVRRVGVRDTFGESGLAWELLDNYGLSEFSIVHAVREGLRLRG